jgi:hypothetical protein
LGGTATDLLALARVLEQARASGDRSAVADALKQLDVEELPPEPGETRRFRIAGLPPDNLQIQFSPGPAPPATFPPDLAWIPHTRIAVGMLGEGALQAMWFGVEPESAVAAIITHAEAHGWREPPAFPYRTAAGVKPRYLERDGITRTLIALGAPPNGMVQMMQPPARERPGGTAGSTACTRV